MNCEKKDLILYAVTDRHWLNGETLYSQVEKVLKGGQHLSSCAKRIWMKNISWKRQKKSRSFAVNIMFRL